MSFILSALAIIGLVTVVFCLIFWEENKHEKQKEKILIRRDSPRVRKLIATYNKEVQQGVRIYSEMELSRLIET